MTLKAFEVQGQITADNISNATIVASIGTTATIKSNRLQPIITTGTFSYFWAEWGDLNIDTNNEHGVSAAYDSNGNIYVVGGVYTNQSGTSVSDTLALKYDPNGNLLWTKTWRDPINMVDNVCAANNSIIVKNINGVDKFYYMANQGLFTSGGVWLGVCDTDGNDIGSGRLSGINNFHGADMEVTDTGDIIIAGASLFTNTNTATSTSPILSINSTPSITTVVASWNIIPALGTTLTISGSDNIEINGTWYSNVYNNTSADLYVDAELVTPLILTTSSYTPSSASITWTVPDTYGIPTVVKYDSNYNVLWSSGLDIGFMQAYWQIAPSSYFKGISIDSANNVYAIGDYSKVEENGIRSVLCKFSSTGTVQWSRELQTVGGPVEFGLAVGVNPVDGYIYTIVQDYGTSHTEIGKWNSDGDSVWKTNLGLGTLTYGYDISFDSTGNIYVTGNTSVTSGESGIDMFYAKISSSGEPFWVTSFGGTFDDTSANDFYEFTGARMATTFNDDRISITGITLTSTSSSAMSFKNIVIAQLPLSAAVATTSSYGAFTIKNITTPIYNASTNEQYLYTTTTYAGIYGIAIENTLTTLAPTTVTIDNTVSSYTYVIENMGTATSTSNIVTNTWSFNTDGSLSTPGFTLPSSDGTALQTMVTDGNGGVTWMAQGSKLQSYFVAANADGTVSTSLNGAIWTAGVDTGDYVSKVATDGKTVTMLQGSRITWALFDLVGPVTNVTPGGIDNINGDTISWQQIDYSGGYFIAVGSIRIGGIGFTQGVWGYSIDGISWTFKTVNQSAVTYFGNNPVDIDWTFTDIDYNGVGWTFSVGLVNGGGVYILDPMASITIDNCFSMIPSAGTVWSGNAWFMRNLDTGSAVNISSDPRVDLWNGPIDPWGTSANDVGYMTGGESSEVAGGNGYIAISNFNGQVAWSNNTGTSWHVSVPIPYVSIVTDITLSTTSVITLTGVSQVGVGEKLVITNAVTTGYNGTFYIDSSNFLYTNIARTSAFDTSGLAVWTGTATLTWSHGMFIDATDYVNGYFYIGNDVDQIARSSDLISWDLVDDKNSLLDYWNDIAGYTALTNGFQYDRLTAGNYSAILDTTGKLALPGRLQAATIRKTSGDSAGTMAIDLTKQVNKLVPWGPPEVFNGAQYTLADGVEGQILYLVAAGIATTEGTTMTINHARYKSGTDIVEQIDAISWLPFTNGTSVTLVFTDGHWNLPHSIFD